MPTDPLVSCIMPTRNRRHFVSQAIWYFLRQEYTQRELIIIDDGEDVVRDLVPEHTNIRYEHLGKRVPLGTKRNIACEMSQGELIAHWDDDDWIAPQRLSVQVEALQQSGADVCGLRDVLYYHLEAGEAWQYCYPAHERPWVAGCTLLYRRSLWTSHRFPALHSGEDTAFVFTVPPERIHAIPALSNTPFYIALIHARNAGSKNLADPRWQRRMLSEVTQSLGFDREFYVELRSGRVPIRNNTARTHFSSVTLVAPVSCSTGYGSMAEYLALGLDRAGGQVQLSPLSVNHEGLSTRFLELLHASRPEASAPLLYFHWIRRADLEPYRRNTNLFIYTMWESSHLPPGWAEEMNRARAVIAPTRFVARMFRESGVSVPIEVAQQGIDPEVYHYEERPNRGLTTLMVCPVDMRKNTRVGIAAWKQVFAHDPDARLIIKTNYAYHNYIPDDPRIRYVDANEATRGIAHWYRQADVLLALGNEGFGLPMVEAMATGLPVIALTSEGQGDMYEDAREYFLPVEPHRWEPYNPEPFGSAGVRGIPDVTDVAHQLRRVAEHRDEARAMGRAASAWVTRERNIWRMGATTLEIMERYQQPIRPLRKIPTLWVPSWENPCGVAEYTHDLIQTLPQARVVRQAPDPRTTWLLHIQHEPGLFQQAELAQQIQPFHHQGVPIAITAHLVSTETQLWERNADMLITLTKEGAERLQARWPTKRVEHVAPGCPTWFPRRKHERGKVIGVFGFLETYKGFWELPNVLRALPGSELVMYSYAKSAENEASWEAAAAGVAVRRERFYLPIEEIARRLAAEADILVFWYQPIPHAVASYAVRIGLATGVPVLTSPTSWFGDLRGATYQPTNLLAGVQRLLEDTALRTQVTERARDYCHTHTWRQVAERHQELWRTLETK